MPTLRVAGNLLLCGEYAILEEGGTGLALAVEPRVSVRLDPARELSVTARWGSERASFSPSTRPDAASFPATLIDAVYASFERWRLVRLGAGRAAAEILTGRIDVDSSALYGPHGEKLGLGSSAAAAVGIAAALMRLADPNARPNESELFEVALAAHRAFQGGSGYDVAASSYGGTGLFTGGSSPAYRRVALPWFHPFRVVHLAHAVKTPGAVERYRSWKGAHPEQARRFLARSNEITGALVAAASWDEARELLCAAARLGVWLGEQIGVPAAIDATAQQSGDEGATIAKALGAGNEIAAVWSNAPAPNGSGLVEIARQGVEWSAQ